MDILLLLNWMVAAHLQQQITGKRKARTLAPTSTIINPCSAIINQISIG